MDVLYPYKIFSKLFFLYKLIDEQISHLLCAQFANQGKKKKKNLRSFISNSFLRYSIAFRSSSGVPIIFQLTTYIVIIANPDYDFFIKTRGHIELF